MLSGCCSGTRSVWVTSVFFRSCLLLSNVALMRRNTATDSFRRYQSEWYSISLFTLVVESSVTTVPATTSFLISGSSSGISPMRKGCCGHSDTGFHRNSGPFIQRECCKGGVSFIPLEASSAGLLRVSTYFHW